MLDKTGIFEIAEIAEIVETPLPLSSRACVRCGSKERYTTPAKNEHCRCGCLVPQCYTPMKGCCVAHVKDVKVKHDPPSPADLAERRAGVQFINGDIDAYIRDQNNALIKAAKVLRKMEEKLDCQCKNCKKEKGE